MCAIQCGRWYILLSHVESYACVIIQLCSQCPGAWFRKASESTFFPQSWHQLWKGQGALRGDTPCPVVFSPDGVECIGTLFMYGLGREVQCVLGNFNFVVIGDKNHIRWLKDTKSERNSLCSRFRKSKSSLLLRQNPAQQNPPWRREENRWKKLNPGISTIHYAW